MFSKEKCIYLGKITRTHGVRGQLVLATELSLKEEHAEEPILVDLDGGLVPFFLDKKEGLRFRDYQSYLIRFDHVQSREQATPYVGCEAYLLSFSASEQEKLSGTPSALKNYAVYNQYNGYIGKVDAVLDFSGNTLLSVFATDKEVLLPFTEAHILSWSHEERTLQLQIPEGLLAL